VCVCVYVGGRMSIEVGSLHLGGVRVRACAHQLARMLL
jgi:hypothetical protein